MLSIKDPLHLYRGDGVLRFYVLPMGSGECKDFFFTQDRIIGAYFFCLVCLIVNQSVCISSTLTFAISF